MRANSSASESCSQSLNLLKYETDTVPDWNPEFLNACVAQSGSTFLFVIPLCSPPCRLFVTLPKHFSVYTSCADQRRGQRNHQLHKESRGGDSGLHDGLLQHFKPCVLGFDTVCSGMPCGLACLDFVSSAFSCFQQTLGGEISNFL